MKLPVEHLLMALVVQVAVRIMMEAVGVAKVAQLEPLAQLLKVEEVRW